ncbi:DinB family protein [Flammeovirga sp. EKP202]|uniref:DinB family protein n=1 Tax=Flammeovirga sp. EKP202 TaxID=2770592 RepID=UPI00165ED589|nr:DinB family protein [Flammeovirga sp. EKP202]MBD0404984.1 DinB family protein [Flammeovirga sp. EKP202]
MEKSEPKQNTSFLDYVYQLNEGRALEEAFQLSIHQINSIDIAQLKRIGLKTYAENKWSIHKIIQHLIDWERIWCYRAIIFARNEGSTPDANDQEIMASHSNADELTIDQLINELKVVRQSSKMMFDSFNQEILDITCKFFDYEMPLSAIAYTITAHQIHHLNVINERYLPLDK